MQYGAGVFDDDRQDIDETIWCNTKEQTIEEAKRIIDRLLEESEVAACSIRSPSAGLTNRHD